MDKPTTVNFTSVKSSLSHIVTLALDSDPSLVPISCKAMAKAADTSSPDNTRDTANANIERSTEAAHGDGSITPTEEDGMRDPDDFRFWSESQAVRISKAIKEAFEADLTPEVIIADANLSALANRILVARDLLEA